MRLKLITAPKTIPARRVRSLLAAPVAATLCLLAVGCHKQDEAARQAAEAPPAATTTVTATPGLVHVEHPELFPLASVAIRQLTSTLDATGSVNPDISRELPVLSLANGRVVALNVRLGDTVRKGQLIMRVQSPDVATAFATYIKAVSDEHLTRITLDRDKLLYDKGAIPQTQLEAAQNGEDDAITNLKATEQQLRILGVDKDHPGDTVSIYAPTSGVVISQSATAASAAGVNFAGAAGSLIIADLSHVWIICDVYENDLASIKLGEQAEIRLAAYPGKVLHGTIGDIGATLDASIRTAKVRIQVPNPDGILRLGMFATATFRAARSQSVPAVPADAVLHLHDRTYVFERAEKPGDFRTFEVRTGRVLPGNLLEITQGLNPGQQVVQNALQLENTAAQ